MQAVDDIFQELLSKIGEPNGTISGFCGEIYDSNATCIKRCREIVNLMLYMRGYEHKGTQGLQRRTVDQADWTAFQEYLRCVLAGEALVRLYGRNSDHVDVMNKVKQELAHGKTFVKQKLESGICENRDWGKVIFQSHRMGTALQNRLNSLRKTWTTAKVPARRASGTCGWDDAQDADEDGKPHSDDTCNANEGVVTQENELMKEIKGWVPIGPFPHVQKVLEDMQKNGVSKEKCELEQKIRNGVKTVKDRVNPPKKSQPPEKPAGANGNPRGPVQTVGATPVSPPGSGTPTSPSGGGGGKGGATGGGQGQGKAGLGQHCDGDFARQRLRSAVYVVPPRDVS
ncbi:hypothetical protein AK88_05527 [Plasmodium fragile]|uniref:Schizont-infected cell agglutination extracellular alpha domain-containing protein n=1 Tax=Plasmodium fragile TaxID=5857 RepID=A0A0D9QCY6_PLAFR|nr:uncharacterized protein AK88_05527 [Plasmodium fragile]KJP84839.1 hypothetical protein AK88_05527 [Plasmodium fragile]